MPVVAVLEERLAPYGARPHWGKVFGTAPDVVASLYPRHADARSLRTELDPGDVRRLHPTVVWANGQRYLGDDERDAWRDAGAEVREVDSGLPQVEEPGRLRGLLAFAGV